MNPPPPPERNMMNSVASRQVGELGVTVLAPGATAFPPPPSMRSAAAPPAPANGVIKIPAMGRSTLAPPPPSAPPPPLENEVGAGAPTPMPRDPGPPTPMPRDPGPPTPMPRDPGPPTPVPRDPEPPAPMPRDPAPQPELGGMPFEEAPTMFLDYSSPQPEMELAPSAPPRRETFSPPPSQPEFAAQPRGTMPMPPPSSPPPMQRERADTEQTRFIVKEEPARNPPGAVLYTKQANYQARPYNGGFAPGPPGGAARDDWIKTSSGRWIAPEEALSMGVGMYQNGKQKLISHHFDGRFMSQAPAPIYIPQKSETSRKALAEAARKQKSFQIPKLRAPAMTGIRTKTGRFIPGRKIDARAYAAASRRQEPRAQSRAQPRAQSRAQPRSPPKAQVRVPPTLPRRRQKASEPSEPLKPTKRMSGFTNFLRRNSRDPVRPSIQPRARKAKEGTKTKYIGAKKVYQNASANTSASSASTAATATSAQENKKLFDNRMKEIKVLRKMTMQFTESPVKQFSTYDYRSTAGGQDNNLRELLRKQEKEIQMLKKILEKLQKQNMVTQNNVQYRGLPTV